MRWQCPCFTIEILWVDRLFLCVGGSFTCLETSHEFVLLLWIFYQCFTHIRNIKVFSFFFSRCRYVSVIAIRSTCLLARAVALVDQHVWWSSWPGYQGPGPPDRLCKPHTPPVREKSHPRFWPCKTRHLVTPRGAILVLPGTTCVSQRSGTGQSGESSVCLPLWNFSQPWYELLERLNSLDLLVAPWWRSTGRSLGRGGGTVSAFPGY